MKLICAPCCDSSSCWCHDYKSRWIPSLDVNYAVDELGYEYNGPNEVRVFRYRHTERLQHEQT